MTLTPRLLGLALFCANSELAARRDGKPPGVRPWNAELVRALELEVSSSRHDSGCDETELEHDRWISSQDAARMLGWNIKRVQRRADELGARKVAGKIVLRERVVRRYAEELKGGRIAG